MTETIDLPALADLVQTRAADGRVIVAMVGAPGSGKSTLADRLAGKLNARQAGLAAVLPMDGYHYDDTYLTPQGWQSRKGAPHTFDVGGLCHTLQRMRARDEAEVAVPVFDRQIEIARAGARLIPASIPVIIVEGNYLLLNLDPWPRLRPMFDLTVMIDVPEGVLKSRLTARWVRYGLTPPQIAAKLAENDLPNGRLIRSDSAPATYRIANA